jgi:hypothetical protein
MNRASVWRSALEEERQAGAACLELIHCGSNVLKDEDEDPDDWRNASRYYSPGERELEKLSQLCGSIVSTKATVILDCDMWGEIIFDTSDCLEGSMAYTGFKLPASLGKRWKLTGKLSDITPYFSTWFCCSYALNRYLARCFRLPKDELAILNLQPHNRCGFFLNDVDVVPAWHISEMECLYTDSRACNYDTNLVPSRLGLSGPSGAGLANCGTLLHDRISVEGVTMLADMLLLECPAELSDFELDLQLTTSTGTVLGFRFSSGELICLDSSESRDCALYALPLDPTIECKEDVNAYLRCAYAWLAQANNPDPFPATTCIAKDIKIRMSASSFVDSIDISFYIWIFDGSRHSTDRVLSRPYSFSWTLPEFM